MLCTFGLTLLAAAAVTNPAVAPSGAPGSRPAAASELPPAAEIHGMLAERIGALAGRDDGVGIVVGTIGPRGRSVVAYGQLDRGDTRALNGDTVFEIGSVGKVFTALLLADMVRRGEVALTDPVSRYLPAGVTVPVRNGRPITLGDLATHTSGLPFMPDTYPTFNDPAAAKAYGDRQIYEFLGRCRLASDPGAEWNYSNLDYWLLGRALAGKAGTSFETLLRSRVLALLGLESTAATVSPGLRGRLAVGHDALLERAPAFESTSVYAALGPAAGGLVSTANDLLRFLAVEMGYETSPLAPSMAAMLATRRPVAEGTDQALGWMVSGKGPDVLVSHEGGTWGFVSFVAWDPARRVGVVVLSNQPSGVADIGRHILRADVPLEKPVVTRRAEIALDPATLDAWVGRYEAEEEGIFEIARVGDHLTVRLPIGWGLPVLRLRPESRLDFFVAELPVRATFQTGPDGQATGILVYPPRGQRALPARRLPGGAGAATHP